MHGINQMSFYTAGEQVASFNLGNIEDGSIFNSVRQKFSKEKSVSLCSRCCRIVASGVQPSKRPPEPIRLILPNLESLFGSSMTKIRRSTKTCLIAQVSRPSPFGSMATVLNNCKFLLADVLT